MMRFLRILALLTLAMLVPGRFDAQTTRVTLGIEILLSDSLHLLAGKNVGVVCNHTSRFPNGTHLVDSLRNMPEVRLAAIFTPEHGFTGTASAGEHVSSDRIKEVPVHSLYGNTRRPTKPMLKDIDVLVFDMQDIGARFYTYTSTMGYCMEAASEHRIPMIVCDRPNPIRGDIVQGPLLDMKQKSFVGLYPIPIRHGLTVAELACMAKSEGWLHIEKLELHPIPMRGWRRSMWYDETGLPWVPPSPNIPDLKTAIVYPGTCLVEGTNISEGRGTEAPFLMVGAPYLNGEALAEALARHSFHGLRFQSVTFTPQSMRGASKPKHQDKECGGVRIFVLDRDAINPIFAGVAVIAAAAMLQPESLNITPYMPLLLGQEISLDDFSDSFGIPELLEVWSAQAYGFSQRRNTYLLYE